MITWEQLTEAEQEALKRLSNKQPLSVAASIRLELLGLTQTLESENGYEGDELTDLGRALLAQAGQPDAGLGGEWVNGKY